MNVSILAMGVFFVIIGYGGRLWIGRRQFYRRNQAGVEEFENYTKVVTTSLMEGFVSKCSNIAIVIGLLLIVMAIIPAFAR